MHLVGFIMRIYHDARSPERQIYLIASHILEHNQKVRGKMRTFPLPICKLEKHQTGKSLIIQNLQDTLCIQISFVM